MLLVSYSNVVPTCPLKPAYSSDQSVSEVKPRSFAAKAPVEPKRTVAIEADKTFFFIKTINEFLPKYQFKI